MKVVKKADRASLVAQMVKESIWNAGDLDSIPEMGRSFGWGHGKPLQYSYLENSQGQEPGRLESMESQRVRHDWVNKHITAQESSILKALITRKKCNHIRWQMLTGLIVLIILQYIQISNHYVTHLKHIMSNVNYSLIKIRI